MSGMFLGRGLCLPGGFAAFALCLVACAEPAVPSTTAARVESLQCPGVRQDEVAVVQRLSVLSATPIYTVQPSKDGDGQRVSGVKLVVRPPEGDGVTPERLTRTLQCHTARALLGQVDRSQLADDPYWLPDEWLDISVVSEDGNYAVALRADSIAKNLEVLNRVTSYARTHGALRTAQ